MQAGAFQPIHLPTGQFHITPALDDSIRQSSGAPARIRDNAHPIFGFVSALGGAGLRIADILTLCDCSIEDGPVLASCDLTMPRSMKVGRVYQVTGEISSCVRKLSRRFGAADHVRLQFDLASGEDDYGRLRLHMIVPSR